MYIKYDKKAGSWQVSKKLTEAEKEELVRIGASAVICQAAFEEYQRAVLIEHAKQESKRNTKQ